METIHEHFSELTQDQVKLLILTIINIPPVSLDLLTMISALSPVTALQALQDLVDKGILEMDEEKGFGHYRLPQSQNAEDLIELADKKTVSEMVEKTVQHLNEAYEDVPNGWIALAHLQTMSGIQSIDPAILLKAAQFLRNENRTETADTYFNKVLEILPTPCTQDDDRQMFIEAVHGLLSTRYKSMPMPEQMKLLERARSYTKEIGDTEREIRLSIHLARVCSYAGNHQQTAQLSDEAWDLTEKWEHENREQLRRWVALATSEFLAWEGRFSEALKRYENTIGNLEEFSSDSATLRAYAWLGYYYCQCGQSARGIGLMEAVRLKAMDLNHKTAENWATLLMSTMLAEAGRLPEAESVSEILMQQDQNEFGLVGFWLLKYLQAYIRFRHNDMEGCYRFHNQASELLQAMGWWHLPIPLVLEYLEALEERGMVPPKCSFDTLISENLIFPDIFMQGVALRFRVQFRLKNASPNSEAIRDNLADLKKSLDLLNRAGAKVQRSYTQILMARILTKRQREPQQTHPPNYLQNHPQDHQRDHQQDKKVYSLLKEAWDVLSGINESLFPNDLKYIVQPADREERLVQSLIEVGNTLGTVREKNQLIRKIIQVVMNFSQVEKGAMFLSSPQITDTNAENRTAHNNSISTLELTASRNIDSVFIRSKSFEKEYAWIVDSATHGRELIFDDEEILEKTINDKTPIEHDNKKETQPNVLESRKNRPCIKICCPVMLGNKIFGVLYLESGGYGATLSTKDLPFLRVLSNQIAVALDNIYAYEEISHLKERLLAETHLYQEDLQKELPKFGQIIGESKGMQNVFGKIRQVAKTDSTVLITGETGVGKELVARSIHQLSNRSDGPFIALNTAALDSNLVGSELFGHEKGAFTNAISTRLGRFELADQGTIFLDDVDNLQPDIQAKLLRVIQEKEFERIGGKKTIQSDFRLITATNRNLKILASQDRFREDLYYRLNTFPIHVPPLRERGEDIPRLAHFFLKSNNKKLGKNINGIATTHMKRLQEYSWPGNVRELKHVIERASIISAGNKLTIPDLKEETHAGKLVDIKSKRFQTLEDVEKEHIIKALERSGSKVSGAGGAAELLGLKTSTLNSKMKKLGISRKVNYKIDSGL